MFAIDLPAQNRLLAAPKLRYVAGARAAAQRSRYTCAEPEPQTASAGSTSRMKPSVKRNTMKHE
jgi:hypothetical protein